MAPPANRQTIVTTHAISGTPDTSVWMLIRHRIAASDALITRPTRAPLDRRSANTASTIATAHHSTSPTIITTTPVTMSLGSMFSKPCVVAISSTTRSRATRNMTSTNPNITSDSPEKTRVSTPAVVTLPGRRPGSPWPCWPYAGCP